MSKSNIQELVPLNGLVPLKLHAKYSDLLHELLQIFLAQSYLLHHHLLPIDLVLIVVFHF